MQVVVPVRLLIEGRTWSWPFLAAMDGSVWVSWQMVTATRGPYVAGVAAVLWPRFAASLELGLIRLLLL